MVGNSAHGRREVLSGLIQRGVDTAAEFSDVLSQRLATLADPRAKLLRKRRWARRLCWFFAGTTAFWVAVTGLLASWSTPVWALIVTGAIAEKLVMRAAATQVPQLERDIAALDGREFGTNSVGGAKGMA